MPRIPSLLASAALAVAVATPAAAADCRAFEGTVRSPAPVVRITASRVNLRAGPSTGSRIVGELSDAELPLYVEEQCGRWARIRARAPESAEIAAGWIHLDHACTPAWALPEPDAGEPALAPPCPAAGEVTTATAPGPEAAAP